jgi:hypothetical protein
LLFSHHFIKMSSSIACCGFCNVRNGNFYIRRKGAIIFLPFLAGSNLWMLWLSAGQELDPRTHVCTAHWTHQRCEWNWSHYGIRGTNNFNQLVMPMRLYSSLLLSCGTASAECGNSTVYLEIALSCLHCCLCLWVRSHMTQLRLPCTASSIIKIFMVWISFRLIK